MSFIGIVANKKFFENIKRKIIEQVKDETINFIQINLRSIENIKNIKFETIVIEDNIKKFENNKEILENICSKCRYLIINTDKNKEYKQQNNNNNLITYGLNQNATITVSSISDANILIYLQKSLKNRENNKIEIEERRISKEEKNSLKTYEILVIYTLLAIYGKTIINKI